MQEIRLSDEQLVRLADLIARTPHHCRFDEQESKTLHRFAQSLENGGWAKWDRILSFGGHLIQADKAGVVALVTLAASAVVAVIWAGVLALVHGGKQ
jgi:hypothetical protein